MHVRWRLSKGGRRENHSLVLNSTTTAVAVALEKSNLHVKSNPPPSALISGCFYSLKQISLTPSHFRVFLLSQTNFSYAVSFQGVFIVSNKFLLRRLIHGKMKIR